ncbi:MAG: hypothetical protein Q7T33_00710 [Dehalococcoidia bacterium]|nr:hypothetical protein [Dehalococcoidia bacterium]
MNAKQLWISVAAVVLSAVVTAGFTGAIQIPWDGDSQPASAVGGPSKIHFNGVLTDPATGNPLNGFFGMTFRFFTTETEGTALWSETQDSVRVNKGVFNVFLGASTPFPALLFEQAPLFLEIQVGSDLPMTPRQEMARVPAAFFADRADHANNSDNSTHANNSDRSTNSDRSDRSTNSDNSDRAGVANDLDCTGCVSAGELGTVGPVVAGQVLFFDGTSLVWKTMYLPNHTILVSPIGTPVQNGVVLLNALAGITAASDVNPYLIKIEPGVYEIMPPDVLQMKRAVDIEGSGEGVTHIVGTGVKEVVRGVDGAELRFLSVENTGNGSATSTAVAIANYGTSPRLTHVTARASNAGTVYAILNQGPIPSNPRPIMTDVTAVAFQGTSQVIAIRNVWSSPIMNDVTAQASDGGMVIAVENVDSKPEMTDVTAEASNGSTQTIGVRNVAGAPVMNRVTARATSGGDNAAVLNVSGAAVTIDGLVALAEGTTASASAVGVETHDSATVTIHGSSITATSVQDNYAAILNDTGLITVDTSELIATTGTIVKGSLGSTTRIGASLMSGGPVGPPGTVTCAGVHDETYTFFTGPACP